MLLSKREREKAIFKAFLSVAPKFAGETIASWNAPEDENAFPDIAAVSESGRRIGVELGEWLNQDEMRFAKGKERDESAILKAIGAQGENSTRNINYLWLHPNAKVAIPPSEQASFRDQLFECIDAVDERWPRERFTHRSAHLSTRDLEPYPALKKHLTGLTFHGRHDAARGEFQFPRRGVQWITFPFRTGSYDEKTMLEPLRGVVSQKVAHYSRVSGFDHLSLLIYRDLAILYNSPVGTPWFKIEDYAADVGKHLAADSGPFDSIYLFSSERVFRLDTHA